jgi:hypothetical protein
VAEIGTESSRSAGAMCVQDGWRRVGSMSWRSRAADAVGEAPYELEVVLQELLATHPDLLAGDQMNEDAPRRWLLVRREAGCRMTPPHRAQLSNRSSGNDTSGMVLTERGYPMPGDRPDHRGARVGIVVQAMARLGLPIGLGTRVAQRGSRSSSRP